MLSTHGRSRSLMGTSGPSTGTSENKAGGCLAFSLYTGVVNSPLGGFFFKKQNKTKPSTN